MSNTPTTAERPLRSFWQRISIRVVAICCLPLLIPASIIAWYWFLHDFENVPLCGKQTFIDVSNWYDRQPTPILPNVDGRSIDSLAKLIWYDAEDAKLWNRKYQYVPGLRKGDPGELVMMYMKSPTRWVHHAAGPPSIFDDYKWVLVPLDFAESGNPNGTRMDREIRHGGESFERVSDDELQSRLRKTIKFLQDNDRPHWQTVAAENEVFLKSLERNTATNDYQ